VRSAEPFPHRLARDAERRSDLGPALVTRSKQINHRLELVALALQRLFDGLKRFEQAFRWQFAVGSLLR